MSNDRKVVLVTGCAKGGIGYEYCKAFASRNCDVFASDIPQRMSELDFSLQQHDSATKIEALELDVSCDESVSKAINHIISQHKRLDVLINNAGIGNMGPIAELPLDAIKKTFEINALGQLRLVQQVVPYMTSRRAGTIVNIGSVVGRVPTPWAGAYCASKAYVHAISHTLRVELKPFGVDVVIVYPGAVRSSFGSGNVESLKSCEWKIYKGFERVILERANASQSGKSTDPEEFARYVADKVLGSDHPPKTIKYGHMSRLFDFLEMSPLWVRDFFFGRRFKKIV